MGGSKTPQPQKVNLSGVSLTDPNAALGQYAYQSQQLPGVQQTATEADTLSNQAYQQMLLGVDPNLKTQIGQIGTLASSYLSGIIPQDVQDQIQRATAQQSLQGGYGGTQMARNLTARDLGLTSMNLQQLGTTMAGTAAGMARSINPSFTPVSSLLFTPSQLLARTDQANYYNTDVKNQQAIINAGQAAAAQAAGAAGSQRQQSGIGSMISGISGLFGKGGSLGNLFGGGSGGNVNPNFSPAYGDYQAQQMGYANYDAATAAGAI